MSTESKRTPAAEDLLFDVTTYIEDTEHERRELEGSVANLRIHLTAAEKRAEEAEALALRTGNLVRALSRQVEREISRGALWLPDHACAECVPNGATLIPGFRCARHAALVMDPAGPGPALKSDAADDAEARRDARRDYP